MEPRAYAWILPGRLAVGERPGGGGSNHRRARREAEQAWWRDRGVTAIVSGMKSRHGLVEYALDDFAIRWHPLIDPQQAADELPRLVASVRALLDEDGRSVLVHVNRANEWLAGVDAALRLDLGIADGLEDAAAQAEADGFPVGPLARLLAATVPAAAMRAL
jgi:hypothetical protein